MDEASLISKATQNLSAVLRDAFEMQPSEAALVIYDTEAPLTRMLTAAYRASLPNGQFVDIATETPEAIIARVDKLKPRDIVILVQSTNFRLNEFRFRIELFKRELKTIEHTHLERLEGDDVETYIDSLAYEKEYYRPLGRALKVKLDKASRVVVECEGTSLVYDGPLEETKLNIGDYTEMKNVGGLFPIGEVFTESRDLATVNGDAMVFAFAGDDHKVRAHPPFRISVVNGVLDASEAPEEFQAIVTRIKVEEDVLVRELGLGLNRAMGKYRLLPDVNSFERQQGVHLSIGAKHAMYAKPGLSKKHGRYHVDIFVDATRVIIDGENVFENGAFLR
ncbi:MAG: hypothetical protein ABIO72_00065 [Patescibacteria group bacterium]